MAFMASLCGLSFVSAKSSAMPKVGAYVSCSLAGVSNLWPMGHMQPRMAVNAAQHKIINLLKTW